MHESCEGKEEKFFSAACDIIIGKKQACPPFGRPVGSAKTTVQVPEPSSRPQAK